MGDFVEHGQSPPPHRKLFRQVCAAVQYAHQNLIVHRDIKPSNILVTAEGTPKLLDFGIAKLLDPALQERTVDQTGAFVRLMTPEYASPEQVRGPPVTTASDVYSLGVLLYELLTGRRPYRVPKHPPEEVARVVCAVEPERPSTAVAVTRGTRPERLRRRLAGDLDNIVMKALRKEPQRRYASAEQLSEDIRRHLEGLPVTARRDTLTYRASKFVRRRKVEEEAAALLTLSLAALGRVQTELPSCGARRVPGIKKAWTYTKTWKVVVNRPDDTPARLMRSYAELKSVTRRDVQVVGPGNLS